MKIVISDKFTSSKEELLKILENFDREGERFGEGDRNTIKLFMLNGKRINIKSFKIPNPVNKIAYRFFRKSKAQRSFQYAHELLSRSIGTPYPIAYAEEKSAFSFSESFYISRQLKYDLTYRELVTDRKIPNWEQILRAFTRFTFELHEKQVLFLDHSPGNTLIQVNNDKYEFFLVDLNRMTFKNLSFDERMQNFSRLTPHKEMVEIMAAEYSKLIKKPENEVMERMWHYTQDFQTKFRRKHRLKKKLKFWKN